MDRRPNNQKRFEEAVRRLFQRGAGNNEPDITRYQVLIDGEPFFIGERKIEIQGENTIATYTAPIDSAGKTFTHIRDFVLTSCGCKLNIKTQKIYRCYFCKKTVCPVHSIRWQLNKSNNQKINITFCRNKKCQLIGRFLQLAYYTIKFFQFSIFNIIGIEAPAHRPSLFVQGGDEENEEKEMDELDEGRKFKKRRNRDWDFD